MIPHDICERVAHSVESLDLRGRTICAAVSGGPDSIALLYLLHRLRSRIEYAELAVVHVNHSLRAEESDADAQFVKENAARLGLRCHSAKIHAGPTPGENLESWARNRRYAIFRQIRQRFGYAYVATGHTRDDQAETVLMRCMRGSGIFGMQGIKQYREDGIIRPMLQVSKKEIVAWCQHNSITYRTDPTNASRRFTRNWLRHELLQKADTRIPDALFHTSSFADEASRLVKLCTPMLNKWIERSMSLLQPMMYCIDRASMHESQAGDALALFFRRCGIPLRGAQLETVLTRARSAHTHAVVLCPDGWQCILQKTRCILYKPHDSLSEPSHICEIALPGTSLFPADRCAFFTSVWDKVHIRQSDIPTGSNEMRVQCDALRCGGRLWYRPVRENDLFTPFGSSREIRVGSFLKKQRIPRRLHGTIRVVTAEDDSVLWIPGIRLSNRVRVEPSTQKIYSLHCSYY